MSKILLLFLSITLVNAQDIQIKVKGHHEPLSCHESGENYFCRDGESYLFVKNSGPFVSAYGNLNNSDEDEVLVVEEIRNTEDDQVLYESAQIMGGGYGGFPGGGMGIGGGGPAMPVGSESGLGGIMGTPPKPPKTLSMELMNQTNFEMFLDPPKMADYGIYGGSTYAVPEDTVEFKAFKAFKAWALKRIKDKKNKILQKFLKDEYQVELKNGKQLACKRSKTTTNQDPYAKSLERQLKHEVKCGVFDCGKDKAGNRLVLFSHPNHSMGYNDLLAVSPQGFVKAPKFKRIFSKNSKTPLVELPEIMGGFGAFYTDKPQISTEDTVPSELKDQKDFFQKINYPNYELTMAEAAISCRLGDLAFIAKAREAFDEKLAKANLVQYISASDNVLTGYFLSPESIPGYACHENGIYYNPKYYEEAKKLRPLESHKVISMEKAQELFDKARAMDDIAWDFKMDGCYARAHLMARRFEEEGVHVDKAWLKGNLNALQDDGSNLNWNFHVAPVVYVKGENGEVQRVIIDPSVEKGPVPVSEWAGKLGRQVPGGIQETSFPYPNNSISMKRVSLAISNSDPYLPYDSIGITEESKMQQSLQTMKQYKGALNAEGHGIGQFGVY